MDLERTASRRRLLAATIGSLAAAGAATIGAPVAALAADDAPLLLGNDNEATSMTSLTRTTVPRRQRRDVLRPDDDLGGGSSATPRPVQAWSVGAWHGTGVQGYSETGAGLNGFGPIGLWASGDHTGVHGNSVEGKAITG